ncbi:hypothetical protein CTAYLR_005331 [Chrysophaeum taylorii]|uniref:Uncharacterized protein n=1 Tax=Chrysophaeum taylorii TaxID=2483200 RepID=A0AAD7U6R8_9STRA|nr:hypothetical protein CTAYLR_005331 [Chrysophaeum taylorii]
MLMVMSFATIVESIVMGWVPLQGGGSIPQLSLGIKSGMSADEAYGIVTTALGRGYRHIVAATNHDAVARAVHDFVGVSRGDVFLTITVAPGENASAAIEVEADLAMLELSNHDYSARKEAWLSLEEACAAGRVKYLGVANSSVPHLREMARYASITPAVIHLAGSEWRDVRDYCLEHGAVGAVATASTRRVPIEKVVRWAMQRGLVVLVDDIVEPRMFAGADDEEATIDFDALFFDSRAPASGDVLPTAKEYIGDELPAFREVDESEWTVQSVGGMASTPLFRLPWEFDLEALQADARVAMEGWDWNVSEYGHARPLLTADRLPLEFRDHFINAPHASTDLFVRAPTFRALFEWFAERCEVASFRLLRRLPLTAYGLHNDEDLHVRPEIRRFQVPIFAEEDEAFLLATPFASPLSLADRLGVDFGTQNPLLSHEAWPTGSWDYERAPGDPPWYDVVGGGYAVERDRIVAWINDFAQRSGSVYTLTPGRLHHFDTMRRHTLVNLMREPRITLVVDLVENEWMRRVMPAITNTKRVDAATDAAELLRAARSMRDQDGVFLNDLVVDQTFPRQATLTGSIVDDSSATVTVAPQLSAGSHWGLYAFKVLCGRALDDVASHQVADIPQLADGDCWLSFVQRDLSRARKLGDGEARLTRRVNADFDVTLDARRCENETRCALELTIFDSEGIALTPTVSSTAYLRKTSSSSSSFIDPDLASRLSRLSFSFSHGAAPNFLGTGLVYYALCYAQRATLAVVLGSGGGFAPGLIRQAQRDAAIGDVSRTVLVDANVARGPWGSPDYLDSPPNSALHQLYPEIEIVVSTTDGALGMFRDIDLLLIDADHSHGQSLKDALGWLPLLKPTGVAVLHDTGGAAYGCSKTPRDLRGRGYDVVNLADSNWGSGLAIVRLALDNPVVLEASLGTGNADEIYAEAATLAAARDRAFDICARRGVQPRAACAENLLRSAELPQRQDDDHDDDKVTRIAALLAQRAQIDRDLVAAGADPADIAATTTTTSLSGGRHDDDDDDDDDERMR